MYKDWFLDYASYVILERAVPSIEDGFKPVQRRILHSMKDLDDGRFNKVANIVGHTMQYHPHGDASISDAMVQIGQNLLIETQGIGEMFLPVTQRHHILRRGFQNLLAKYCSVQKLQNGNCLTMVEKNLLIFLLNFPYFLLGGEGLLWFIQKFFLIIC